MPQNYAPIQPDLGQAISSLTIGSSVDGSDDPGDTFYSIDGKFVRVEAITKRIMSDILTREQESLWNGVPVETYVGLVLSDIQADHDDEVDKLSMKIKPLDIISASIEGASTAYQTQVIYGEILVNRVISKATFFKRYKPEMIKSRSEGLSEDYNSAHTVNGKEDGGLERVLTTLRSRLAKQDSIARQLIVEGQTVARVSESDTIIKSSECNDTINSLHLLQHFANVKEIMKNDVRYSNLPVEGMDSDEDRSEDGMDFEVESVVDPDKDYSSLRNDYRRLRPSQISGLTGILTGDWLLTNQVVENGSDEKPSDILTPGPYRLDLGPDCHYALAKDWPRVKVEDVQDQVFFTDLKSMFPNLVNPLNPNGSIDQRSALGKLRRSVVQQERDDAMKLHADINISVSPGSLLNSLTSHQIYSNRPAVILDHLSKSDQTREALGISHTGSHDTTWIVGFRQAEWNKKIVNKTSFDDRIVARSKWLLDQERDAIEFLFSIGATKEVGAEDDISWDEHWGKFQRVNLEKTLYLPSGPQES